MHPGTGEPRGRSRGSGEQGWEPPPGMEAPTDTAGSGPGPGVAAARGPGPGGAGAPRRKGSARGAGPRVTCVLTCLAPVASRFPPVPAGPRNSPRPLEAPPPSQAPPPQLTGIPRPPRSLIWRHSAATRLPPSVCPAGRARARDRPRRRAHPRAEATPPHAGAPSPAGPRPLGPPPNASGDFHGEATPSTTPLAAPRAGHPPIPCALN